MDLKPGTTLGAYEILAAVGAGGMGEVYRARDTRLQRDVAVKILPRSLALDPDRLARFEREARVLASLNHAHIATIHGLEESEGVLALVMEYVEGATLADRITEGPLPLDEALRIATEIADALDAAHQQGIVHRDLKPANIKIRPDGGVKVLDFGLAKAFTAERDSRSDAAMNSPTLSARATGAGIVLGTAAYMSPEQARGRPVDRRADIWAFGCVLYEMLTGRQAFAGETASDSIASILQREPALDALPPPTPPAIRRLLRRCLDKSVERRLRDIGDAKLEMEDVVAEPSVPSVAPSPTSSWRRAGFGAAIAAAVLVAGALGWSVRRTPPAEPRTPVRFSIALPPGTDADNILGFPIAVVSPDGARLVLVLARNGTTQLYTRRVDRTEITPITGTEDAQNPFFSPDGNWVAFVANQKLKKVRVDGGGAPLVLCDSDWGGGAWTADDQIIFTPSYTSGLWRLAAGGGTPQKLTDPDTARGVLGHWWPQVLPGGAAVLFTSFSTPMDRSQLQVYSLKTRKATTVVEGGAFGRYISTGHVLYLRSESLVAVPFDLRRLTARGSPVPVLDDVATEFSNGMAHVSVSNTGTLAFVHQSNARPPARLVWVDRAGQAQPILDARRRYADPRLSPDGRRLAIAISDQSRDVWVYDLDRGAFTQVTSDAARDFAPLWTPDGKRLVFMSERPVYQLFWKTVGGTLPEEPLVTGSYDTYGTSFTPDGKGLVLTESHPVTHSDILLLHFDGDRKPRPLVKGSFSEAAGVVSPDGRWLAYVSDESQRNEVYVQPFPNGTERWQVSSEGGTEPVWARSSRELFFRNHDRMMAVAIAPGATFAAGKPVTLFERRFESSSGSVPTPTYDVTADGTRFVMIQRDPQAPPLQIQVVVNWFGELTAKLTQK